MMIDKITSACVKCGKCIQTCPIYEVKKDELHNPRGFLELLSAYNKGEISCDNDLKNIFDSCFLCTSCTEICPFDLKVDKAIIDFRHKDFQRSLSLYKKVILFFLRNRKILDFIAKLGYIFNPCIFKIQNGNLGMKSKFNISLIKKDRLFPSFTKKSFLKSNADFIDNQGEKTIGFFVGCLQNYFYDESAKAVLKIAKKLKINVDLLKDQNCCAVVHFFNGDFKSVEKLAKKNIEYFEKKLENLDAIIIAEATCSSMIRKDYEYFFNSINQKEWAKRAKKLSSKIYLATEYFYHKTSLKELLSKQKKTDFIITYHDPCHSKKTQGIFKEPRELLKNNFILKEMHESDVCCGFGGINTQINLYNESLKIADKKTLNIKQTKAHFVSAECSACRMQISNSLEKEKIQTIFRHPLELIAMIID
ncbi:(Fe-S)-binding protein [Campylobacter sp. 2018MI35]|uniref:(Fe-S)-binding protein n=1 Tax=unclassified Campylobacter TaxID=2593542 RepID=UPI0019057C7B|nr:MULTISPECIES: (Fe-S)-binding protein [unclassified Campylobacter]MBK1971082.1 (Fe-S)-binding protein [Campylobacter sp. TTU_617]MBK1992158.1 (Fe-S)-binding protein [Campylobacter sp. 2018MI34]